MNNNSDFRNDPKNEASEQTNKQGKKENKKERGHKLFCTLSPKGKMDNKTE